jgi:hypothetical protein
MKPEDAVRRTMQLGPVLLMAFFRDQDTLMKVVSQLPYVRNMTARAGTECQAFSGTIGRDGTSGFTLVTGGDLTAEETRTAVDLLARYGEDQMFTVPDSLGIIRKPEAVQLPEFKAKSEASLRLPKSEWEQTKGLTAISLKFTGEFEIIGVNWGHEHPDDPRTS